MPAKLIIEEIPASATKEEIQEFFSAIGSVISVRESENNSNSHAWVVEMASLEEASQVVEQLDGVIQVTLAA